MLIVSSGHGFSAPSILPFSPGRLLNLQLSPLIFLQRCKPLENADRRALGSRFDLVSQRRMNESNQNFQLAGLFINLPLETLHLGLEILCSVFQRIDRSLDGQDIGEKLSNLPQRWQ